MASFARVILRPGKRAAPAVRTMLALLGVLCAAGLLAAVSGCGTGGGSGQTAEDLPVRLDKSGAEALLRYYFGAYAGEEGADPFAAGVLKQTGGNYYVDLDTLAMFQPAAADTLRTVAGEDALNWDELVEFVRGTYYTARGLPQSLSALKEQTGYTGEDWFTVDVHGVMTTARRRIFIDQSALRAALAGYHDEGEQLIYPTGTTIIGEHYQDRAHVETTVMRRRADDYWDFFTYNAAGELAYQTETQPRSLKSPTQCVGCHLGDRMFEPEESFPAEAPAGPHGPRAVYVGDEMRDMDVVRFFQEHARRSDMVLGLYGTLFVSQLRAQQRAGTIAPRDSALLADLEI